MVFVLTTLVVLSILVFAHELGHFYVAKKFGLNPKEFGFGFPPRIWGIYKDKSGKWKKVRGNREVKDASDTVYSINWVPLGGFVNIGEDEAGGDDPNHFNNQKPWKRAAILSAGVVMNIVLAAVLISIGLMFGSPQFLDEVDSRAQVISQQVQVIDVIPDSPADKAGIETGDVLVSINEKEIAKDQDVISFISEKQGEELNYKIKRGEEEIEYNVIPEVREETGRSGIGINIANTGIVKYPWYLAIYEGTRTAFVLLIAIIVAFYNLFKDLILGHGLSVDLGGPVYIAKLAGDAFRMGIIYLIQFTALLSLNLAVINFLPFPALDGGRVIFIILEKIKGSPVKREVEAAFHYIGFVLLMLLVLVVTFRDVFRVFNGG